MAALPKVLLLLCQGRVVTRAELSGDPCNYTCELHHAKSGDPGIGEETHMGYSQFEAAYQ
jgi:hypothetical protein